MVTTSFTPAQHGFKFSNSFEDAFIELPGGGHAFHTKGRCGGMAFLALDHWHHHKPIPGGNVRPGDETPLARLIQRRLFDSFALNGLRYVKFSLMPLHDEWWGIRKGVAKVTRTEEFPRLKASIDAGIPCALGLCQATAPTPAELGKDHQVVCYGYVEDLEESKLLVYDNNRPLSVEILTFATRYSKQGDMLIRRGTNGLWRAFFVEDYRPQDPPPGL